MPALIFSARYWRVFPQSPPFPGSALPSCLLGRVGIRRSATAHNSYCYDDGIEKRIHIQEMKGGRPQADGVVLQQLHYICLKHHDVFPKPLEFACLEGNAPEDALKGPARITEG